MSHRVCSTARAGGFPVAIAPACDGCRHRHPPTNHETQPQGVPHPPDGPVRPSVADRQSDAHEVRGRLPVGHGAAGTGAMAQGLARRATDSDRGLGGPRRGVVRSGDPIQRLHRVHLLRGDTSRRAAADPSGDAVPDRRLPVRVRPWSLRNRGTGPDLPAGPGAPAATITSVLHESIPSVCWIDRDFVAYTSSGPAPGPTSTLAWEPPGILAVGGGSRQTTQHHPTAPLHRTSAAPVLASCRTLRPDARPNGKTPPRPGPSTTESQKSGSDPVAFSDRTPLRYPRDEDDGNGAGRPRARSRACSRVASSRSSFSMTAAFK